jgi:putative endonuclease
MSNGDQTVIGANTSTRGSALGVHQPLVKNPLLPASSMRFWVYILHSLSHPRTYVGQTGDLDSRLEKPNSGRVKSTKRYRPWELIHREEFSTRRGAMEREKWLKSSSGRKWIALLLARIGVGGLSVSSSRSDDGRDLVPTEVGTD